MASASVTYDEFALVTGAMGAALREPGVVAALTAGPRGASALSLLLWSGAGAQEVMVEWTRITGPAQANAFAQAVTDVPRVWCAPGRPRSARPCWPPSACWPTPPRRGGG